jgi:hypothetical protein
MLLQKLTQTLTICGACLLIVLTTESCTSTKIVTKYDCADAAGVPHDTTVWHFFWGLVQKSDIKPGCDDRFNYLTQVSAKTNFATVVIPFITLGIVIPQKMSWCCAPPKVAPGEIPQ